MLLRFGQEYLKLLFVICFNLAFVGVLIYAFNSPAPTPCNGPDGHRENCLDEKEWEEYCNKVLKSRARFSASYSCH